MKDPAKFLSTWGDLQRDIQTIGPVPLDVLDAFLAENRLPPWDQFDKGSLWCRRFAERFPSFISVCERIQRLAFVWDLDRSFQSMANDADSAKATFAIALGWTYFWKHDIRSALRSQEALAPAKPGGLRDVTGNRLFGFLSSLLIGKCATETGHHGHALAAIADASDVARSLELQEGLGMVAGARGEALLRCVPVGTPIPYNSSHNPTDALSRAAAIDFGESARLVPLGSRLRGRALCYLAHAWSRLDDHSRAGAVTLYRLSARIPSPGGEQFAAAGLAAIGGTIGETGLIDEAEQILKSIAKEASMKGRTWVAAARLRVLGTEAAAHELLSIVDGGVRGVRPTDMAWLLAGVRLAGVTPGPIVSRVIDACAARPGGSDYDRYLERLILDPSTTTTNGSLTSFKRRSFDEGAAFPIRGAVGADASGVIEAWIDTLREPTTDGALKSMSDWWQTRRVLMP